jgi:hypothetical protein
MTAIIIELAFLPFIILIAILAGKRLKVQQAKRMEEYRRSPNSRLIKLND